eukprot:scaffold199696_cov26-Tisochrysis_lutea.AAC.3
MQQYSATMQCLHYTQVKHSASMKTKYRRASMQAVHGACTTVCKSRLRGPSRRTQFANVNCKVHPLQFAKGREQARCETERDTGNQCSSYTFAPHSLAEHPAAL